MNLARTRPPASEYAGFRAAYVSSVPDGDIVDVLRQLGRTLDDALATVPESRAGFRYADGKWSIREVAGHLADAERIFAYRALCMARGDATPLPGFDENAYAAASNADARTLADLRAELLEVRSSTVRLFASLADDAWLRVGNANGMPVSVRAIAYITAGHAIHHRRILAERYAVDA